MGPLSVLTARSGNAQRALAGTPLPTTIVIVPQDAEGRTVVNQTATFTIVSGGGSLSSSTGTLNSDGTITAPVWTLGKSDTPQEMRVTIGTTTTTVTATIQTGYVLEVRFFGAAVASEHRALFTSAAARIRGMIVGALPAEDVTGADVSPCTGTQIPPLTGIIAGLVVYASVDSIDGTNRVLAQAGPCFIRGTQENPDFRTIIGIMKFDSADIVSLAGSGNLQEVITHEMLHVVGLGTFWDNRNLIINSGAPGAAYTGAAGIAGCRAVGGTSTCTSSVPVEDCVGIPPANNCGDGQREAHWKETTFGSELMTPYLNNFTNSLSVMSIRSLEDLNYTVNPAAADAYTIAVGSFSAGGSLVSSATSSGRWELPLLLAPRTLRTIRPTASGTRR